nr:hypothetical protein CFP56_75925 [Quercus suber]
MMCYVHMCLLERVAFAREDQKPYVSRSNLVQTACPGRSDRNVTDSQDVNASDLLQHSTYVTINFGCPWTAVTTSFSASGTVGGDVTSEQPTSTTVPWSHHRLLASGLDHVFEVVCYWILNDGMGVVEYGCQAKPLAFLWAITTSHQNQWPASMFGPPNVKMDQSHTPDLDLDPPTSTFVSSPRACAANMYSSYVDSHVIRSAIRNPPHPHFLSTDVTIFTPDTP